MALVKFTCSPLKVEDMWLNPDVAVRRVDDRKVEIVDENFASSTAGYSTVYHKEDGTITLIITAWSKFSYTLENEQSGIWSYKGATKGFLVQNLIPLQLQDAEILRVEGSYGIFRGPDAFKDYEKLKDERDTAQWELDYRIGDIMGHDPFLPQSTAMESGHDFRIQPALLPQAVRKCYLEDFNTPEQMELMEGLLEDAMKRLYPQGVPEVDVRKLSTDDQDALADELESWVKFQKPVTEDGGIGYIAGTTILRVGPAETGVMYSLEFAHRKQYTEKLQEWMARFYIQVKTPSHAFWKKAHKMVDLAEAKRRRHDMHYGLPKWAIEATHIREECGMASGEKAELFCGYRPTNKMVAYAGTEKYQGKKCHVYVYHYDGIWFGRFLAHRKPAPTKEEYEAAKEAETAVGS